MSTLYTHQDSNIRKTWLLVSLFLVFIIAFGWFFSFYLDNPGILIFAVIFSSVTSFGSYWYSDKLVLAMNSAKEIKHDDNPNLYHIVENLAITAGIPTPKLYIIDDPALNAFATGRDAEHAVIAVTSGLLGRLEKVELEGVIAHEMSHIGNRDILLQTIVVVLVGFVVLLSDLFLRWGLRGKRKNKEGGQATLIITVIGIVLAILSPLFAKLIQMAISRKREFLADASGALLTRYPEGLASALEKISGDPNQLVRANKAMAHMYITNPFKGKKGIRKFFMTHPSVEDRVKALRDIRI